VERPWSDAEVVAVWHLFLVTLPSQSSTCFLWSLDLVFACHWEGETSWGRPAAVGNLVIVIVAKPLCLDGVDCFDRPCQWFGRD
jgi:hypothetical protein